MFVKIASDIESGKELNVRDSVKAPMSYGRGVDKAIVPVMVEEMEQEVIYPSEGLVRVAEAEISNS